MSIENKVASFSQTVFLLSPLFKGKLQQFYNLLTFIISVWIWWAAHILRNTTREDKKTKYLVFSFGCCSYCQFSPLSACEAETHGPGSENTAAALGWWCQMPVSSSQAKDGCLTFCFTPTVYQGAMTDWSDFPQQVTSAAVRVQTPGVKLRAAQPADKQDLQGLLFVSQVKWRIKINILDFFFFLVNKTQQSELCLDNTVERRTRVLQELLCIRLSLKWGHIFGKIIVSKGKTNTELIVTDQLWCKKTFTG